MVCVYTPSDMYCACDTLVRVHGKCEEVTEPYVLTVQILFSVGSACMV